MPTKSQKLFNRNLFIIIFIITIAITGCASSSRRIIDHGFQFDVLNDSPDVILLDYSYGKSSLLVTKARPSPNGGLIRQQAMTQGEILAPDALYVKWKLKDSDETIEDTVYFDNHLYSELKGNTVYFMIKDKQLEVYLIMEKLRRTKEPLLGPKKYRLSVVKKLYPISK